MAVLATQNPTLSELAKRLDPNGQIGTIAEVLSETNEVLEEMPWEEGNLPTGHRHTIRTGLPQPTWRKLYGGVQPTRSTTAQVTDTAGMLEAYSEVDKALADMGGDVARFRMTEDTAHLEGMSQNMADTLFYGDESVNPERFTGLAPRFNDLSAENGDNIIDAGGTGSDNMSVWLVGWSNLRCMGIYPKGSTAGLEFRDLGERTIEDVDGNGGRMQAYRSHYKWHAGLAVRDWRYVVRIANIDKSDLTKDAASGADLLDLMTQALHLPPSLSNARFAFYANRTVTSFLARQHVNKVATSTLTMEQIGQRLTTTFGGIPVRRVDALRDDEARVQ
jgi:hypothetical protein